MALPQNANFRDINKIAFEDLNNDLQAIVGLIKDDHDKLDGVSIGATKVEVTLVPVDPNDPTKGTKNADNGFVKIDGKRTNVYTHPNTHSASMIAGLSKVATSNEYSDLDNTPSQLPASDVYEWAKRPNKPTYTPEEIKAIPAVQKGTINGVAELDNFGKLPKDQLPDLLYELADKGYLPPNEIPIINMKNLVDDPNTVLILGGLTSSLPSGGITVEDLADAKDVSNEVYPGIVPGASGEEEEEIPPTEE